MTDVTIIGCGVIGAAAAYILSGYDLSVTVLEAQNDVATGTTKANSAIIHAGYDPEPESLAGQLNVRGSKMAKEICSLLDVPYKQIGSLVLALSEEERVHIEKLYERGIKNGVHDLQIIDAKKVRELEPNISENVVCALYAPSAAIVNPWEYALAMAENAVENGVTLKLNTKVQSIDKTENGYIIRTGNGNFESRYIINAAGVNAGKISSMIADREVNIIPCRGEYYLLDKSEGKRVNHVIFQCPTKAGKGVLVSPTVHGNLIVGPNAENTEFADKSNTAKGLEFVAQSAKRSVPNIDFRASIRTFAGVRANTLTDDFIIEFADTGFLNLAGMKSPALSAAPAIAERAAMMLKDAGLKLTEKPKKVTTRKKVRFNSMSESEKRELISKNPLYGKVICRCETVTEGEIVDACHSVIPPCSVDGVKRRAGAGMGRCQGGFCSPRVVEILSRELKTDMLDIPQDTEGTYILTGRTKGE